MRTNDSDSSGARISLALLFTLASGLVLCLFPLAETNAAKKSSQPSLSRQAALATLPSAGPNPASGNVGPAPGGPSATWQQGMPTSGGGNVNMESSCVENVTCETFTLTVNGTQTDWGAGAGQRVQVKLNWGNSGNEYDIYIHKGADMHCVGQTVCTGANDGTLVTVAEAGPGLTSQIAYIDVSQWGTGVFTIHVVQDTTPVATDSYTGTATAVPEFPSAPPAAVQDTGPKIGFENFEPPGVLTPVTALNSGGATVEFMGRNAGEPSVGANWATGVVNVQSDLETLFVTFDDSCSLTNPKATWVNRRAPTSQLIDSDPIGFTDRGFTDAMGAAHSRVFAAELTLLSTNGVKISYSDDDGNTWTPTQSGGLASAVDHETIGGGIYHVDPTTGLPPPHSPTYPYAVYYCSQDLEAALCSRSDNGGLTYGPSVPIYTFEQCGGLHGHVKVSPKDGTVYVPNNACNGEGAAVVSQDNGINWNVMPVRSLTVDTVSGSSDPAIGIDANGRVYFAMANADTSAAVAYSDDFGQTWNNIVDVGAVYGVKAVTYPAAVGGDAGRAAVAFYGSTTAPGGSKGDQNDGSFTGVWHLYVAETFDGGNTWTVNDVTPTLPMQRSGIWRAGGGDIARNLLDFFDITIDSQGRVVVGYINGCDGGNCAQAAPTAFGNGYTVTAAIARQSSGRRLLAAHDPPNPLTATSAPGMPFVTERRVGNVIHLAWNEADTGNSTITSYQILRGTASGAETPYATVPGTNTTFDDTAATNAAATYYYKVLAVNGVGTSCANNEIAAPYVGDPCSGTLIHRNDPSHPEATGGTAGNPPVPELLIDSVSVAEPGNANDFAFTMKVGDLTTIPPNSRWRVAWDSFKSPGEQYYVGMTTDQSGNVSFEYGTMSTAVVGLVLGLPTETLVASCTASGTSCTLPSAGGASQYNTDGTITITVPKSAVGNPQPGDLLGAVNGRTFNTGDTPPETLERSTQLIDHTFCKSQADNTYPAATYTVAGNASCAVASAVSRKTHGSAGTFDVPLPLTGTPGIEDRTGPTPGNYEVVVTFAAPVTVSSATVTPGPGGTASVSGGAVVSGNTVTINLTNVSNVQTLSVNLLGVTVGSSTGNVSVPMSVLIGDVNATGLVDSGDVFQVRQQTSKTPDLTNFRDDVNASGVIDSGDVFITRQQTETSLR